MEIWEGFKHTETQESSVRTELESAHPRPGHVKKAKTGLATIRRLKFGTVCMVTTSSSLYN